MIIRNPDVSELVWSCITSRFLDGLGIMTRTNLFSFSLHRPRASLIILFPAFTFVIYYLSLSPRRYQDGVRIFERLLKGNFRWTVRQDGGWVDWHISPQGLDMDKEGKGDRGNSYITASFFFDIHYTHLDEMNSRPQLCGRANLATYTIFCSLLQSL